MSAFAGWSWEDDTSEFNVIEYSAATDYIQPTPADESPSWWESLGTKLYDSGSGALSKVGESATSAISGKVSSYVDDLFGGSRTSTPPTSTGTPGLLPANNNMMLIVVILAIVGFFYFKKR